MIFYATFGQINPLRDNWIEIEAQDMLSAQRAMREIFGSHWANVYSKEDFTSKCYPLGKAGKTIQAD